LKKKATYTKEKIYYFKEKLYISKENIIFGKRKGKLFYYQGMEGKKWQGEEEEQQDKFKNEKQD